MAHFAQVDDFGVVRAVIVIDNGAINGGTFPQSQQLGQAFITGPNPAGMALEGTWIQCSYNGSFRGCFPGIGFRYDPVGDVFNTPGPVLETTIPLSVEGFDESGYTHDTA